MKKNSSKTNYIHVITRNNVEQEGQKSVRSDVVIPNKLGNGETCQGLRHWRLLSKLKNNFSKPVRNDMKEKIPKQVLNDNTAVEQYNIKDKNRNELINFKKVAFTLAEGAMHVDLPPTKVKFAFTLAEVLITLGIIGIVAAMTIPTLITNNQKKQTVVKLQRAISVLNQAYKLSYDDVGELGAEETKDFNSLEYFNTYWAPYIKVSTYCRSAAQCGYQSVQPWLQANNKKSGWYPVETRIRTAFITADGFLYTIFLATWNSDDSKKAEYRVSVDLNGAEGPNKFGRDVFFLSRTQTDGGGIRPYCYEKSNDEVDKDCSTSGVGECCAEKIRRAGWEINRDYPWK